jgi:hypothetical protein
LLYEPGNLFTVRILVYYITLIFFAAACNNKIVEKPVWINYKTLLSVPADSLIFKTKEKNWEASILSFTQPIPLKINYTDSGFILTQKTKYGVIEGPAQIVISKGKHHFYYPADLLNKEWSVITDKDYRSPKTVNPDSSLKQQRIIHTVDHWRNLLYTKQKLQYFFEEEITLSPKAGTFRAIANEPLSAYYIQAGSCVSINVKSSYNKEKEIFTVTAGPLKDKYNNTVADGTLVSFIYNDGEQTHRMEAALLDGVAIVFIPSIKKKFSLFAKVNETISNTIILTP